MAHAHQWFKGGSGDNGSVDTNPKECDGVFMKKPEWMRFHVINNGCKATCPNCKIRIGNVKLSGLKCGCGHMQMPGYQILKKCVTVARA